MTAKVDVDVAELWRRFKDHPTTELRNRLVERYLPPDAAAGMVDAELAHPASRLVVFTARPTRWVSFDFAEG